MNALIELECKPTTYCRELLREKWVEALTTAEFDPCDRLDGRTARKELSLYDAMMAEIYAERNKAKVRRVRKPDNRTRAERLADWDAEKDRRKDRRIDAKCNHINKKFGYLCIEQERRISAEKVARADWELEQDEIAEDEMIARFNAELEEFDRKWREEAEAERRRMREYRKLHDLHEWLKYA